MGEDEAQDNHIGEQHDAKENDNLEKQAVNITANAEPEAKGTYLVNIVLGGHLPLSRC